MTNQKMNSFGGRMRINQFLKKMGDGEIGINFRKDGNIIRFNESEPVLVKPQDGYEFSLSGEVNGKTIQTRAYPVIHRKNSAWCQVEDMGLIEQLNSTVEGVPVDIEDPVCKRLGTRDEVYRGLARKTTGGLEKKDLVKVDGNVISIKENKRLENMKKITTAPQNIRVPGDTEYKFQDVAEGLSLDDLYALAQDDLDVDQRDTVRRFIEYRIASLISECVGLDKLKENGRPLRATDREMREFNSILSAVLNEIPQSVYRGVDPAQAAEEAIKHFCLFGEDID